MNVSVAICTWNRSAQLRRTLETFTALAVPPGLEWELIVVNNNCTDDTDAVAGAFADRLPLRLLHETTPGQAVARNLAIREARGEHIAWTDDDVLVDSNWIGALLQAFGQFDADWVFGSSEPEWPGPPPSWYAPRFRGYFAVLDYGPEPFVDTDFEQPFYGLNFAGRRTAHEALGGFNAEFGFRGNVGGVGEDVDMYHRALAAGMRIVYTPHARVRHIIPPDRVAKSYHRRRQWVANPVVYQHLAEIYPWAQWSMGLPRFFYGRLLLDLTGYVRTLLTFDSSERFHHELQILRFIRLFGEAARRGFPHPDRKGPTPAAAPERKG
jgi:glycosyltransferase involved in cell wall biosynthesis